MGICTEKESWLIGADADLNVPPPFPCLPLGFQYLGKVEWTNARVGNLFGADG